MNYLLLAFAALCISAQFTLTKIYQKRHESGIPSSFFFSMVIATASGVLFLAINSFKVNVHLPSILLALGVCFFTTVNNALSLVVVKYGDVSVYTMFMMLGGMIFPYLYGLIFLKETTTVCGVIGLVVLVISLTISVIGNFKVKNTFVFGVLCLVAFCMNGGVSIFSKLGRVVENALPVYDFMIWNYLFSFIFAAAGLAITCGYAGAKHTRPVLMKPDSGKGYALGVGLIVIIAAISAIGYLAQLIGADRLPAVVLYPVVSGGSIVLTAIAGRLCFGEKFTKTKSISIVLTLVGTLLFLF